MNKLTVSQKRVFLGTFAIILMWLMFYIGDLLINDGLVWAILPYIITCIVMIVFCILKAVNIR